MDQLFASGAALRRFSGVATKDAVQIYENETLGQKGYRGFETREVATP